MGQAKMIRVLMMTAGIWAAASPALERGVPPVVLGMTVEEFQKKVQHTERTDFGLGLVEDERVFEVAKAALPQDVAAMHCRFFHGKLYRIAVEYSVTRFTEEAWKQHLDERMKQYGTVPVDRRQIGERIIEVWRWDDGITAVIYQKENRIRFESQKMVKRFTISTIYLHNALWDERFALEEQIF
jgi:hypothetical protein